MVAVQSGVLCLLFSLGLAAQDGFYWLTDRTPGGPTNQCQLCVYDPNGNLVTSFPYNAFLIPPRVVKSPTGVVWVSNPVGSQVVPHTLAGAGTPIPITSLSEFCVDPNGTLWSMIGAIFAGAVLRRHDAQGNVLQTITLTAGSGQMKSDSQGNIWVLDTLFGQVEKASPNGSTIGPVFLGTGNSSGNLEIDPEDHAWVLKFPGPQARIYRIDPAGNVVFSMGYGDARWIAVDGLGYIRVLVDAALPRIDVLDTTGQLVGSYPLVSAGVGIYSGFSVDVSGNNWVTTALSTVEVYSCSGQLQSLIMRTALPAQAGLGDPTGLHVASILARNTDSDVDGAPNWMEFQIGTSPLEATSVPPILGLSGSFSAGQVFTATFAAPADAGQPYVFGASLGVGGIPVGPYPQCRQIPLDADVLFSFWLQPQNPFALNNVGTLNASGVGATTILIPPGVPSGISFFIAAVSLEALSLEVRTISAPRQITVM